MASLYVLKVPEFEPMLQAVREGNVAVKVEDLGTYMRLSSPGCLSLQRKQTGLGMAVWFGALTGGYVGRVGRFDERELRIVDE